MTIYHQWDRNSCSKQCDEHNHTDTCLAWSGDPTNIPQIHSHGIWCDVGRRILTETTICLCGKLIPAFLWNDAGKLTRDDQPCLYSPLYRRPLWNTLNLLVMYDGKYRGQWLWEKWQSTIAGTDLPAWNGAKSPNWSTTIPILASHEVETPPTPPKSIQMVSGVMLVEGYWLRQQSAIVVSVCSLNKFQAQEGQPATLHNSDHVNGHMTVCTPRWLLISFALAHWRYQKVSRVSAYPEW
jgi:hypothetical protein